MSLRDIDERELDVPKNSYVVTIGKRRGIGPVILVMLGFTALILLIIYIAVAVSMKDGEDAMSDRVKQIIQRKR